LHQQIETRGKHVRGKPHDQCVVAYSQGVMAQTLSQEGSGSESIEVAEADPTIDAGAPEVGGSSIAVIE
jgi:hypothetical protein